MIWTRERIEDVNVFAHRRTDGRREFSYESRWPAAFRKRCGDESDRLEWGAKCVGHNTAQVMYGTVYVLLEDMCARAPHAEI